MSDEALKSIYFLNPRRSGGKPRYPNTVNELLLYRGCEDREKTFITYLADGWHKEEKLSFGKLLDKSRSLRETLYRRGLIPGDRVLLILPTGLPFILSFFAIQMAGMTPIPLYPPARIDRLEHYLRTLTAIVETAKAKGCILDKRLISLINSRLSKHDTDLTFIEEEELISSSLATPPGNFFQQSESTPAFLQYTSGTTSDPKGVFVQQKQLFAQLLSYAETTGIRPGDTAVSWLPLYHDLGLIGMVLATLYAGLHLVLLSPLHFLKEPVTWIRALSHYRASHTCAPNFAYSLAARKCPKELLDSEKIDLSAVKLMGMGGEAVMMKTIEEFQNHFAPYGLPPGVLGPCYGLAENVLGATGHRMGEPTRSTTVSRKGLLQQLVKQPEGEEDRITLPSNGRAMPAVSIRIVDKSGNQLEEEMIGEVWLSGPSVAAGYFDNREATDKTFLAVDNQRWLATGDIGFLRKGDLYLSGRKKELLIVRGKNYAPQDIEQAVSHIKGIRKGSIIAFAAKGSEGESAVIACELDRGKGAAECAIIGEIKSEIYRTFSLPVEVVVVPKGAIPKTSSGKLQRSLLKELYERGRLKTLYPPGYLREKSKLLALFFRERANKLFSKKGDHLREKNFTLSNGSARQVDKNLLGLIAAVKPRFEGAADPQLKLEAIGFDSLERMELWLSVERNYGLKISEEVWNGGLTLGQIQTLIDEREDSLKREGEGEIEQKPSTPPHAAALSLESHNLIDTLLNLHLEIAAPPKKPSKLAPLAFSIVDKASHYFWNLQTAGADRLPKNGGFILAGNHQSLLDGSWIYNALPAEEKKLLLAFSSETLNNSYFLRKVSNFIETIPLSPDRSFLHELKAGLIALANRRILLIFPEGSRTHTGRITAFRPGVALLSLASGMPIVPFRIRGAYDIFPRHKIFPRLLLPEEQEGVEPLTLSFGEQLHPPKYVRENYQLQLNELLLALKSAIEGL